MGAIVSTKSGSDIEEMDENPHEPTVRWKVMPSSAEAREKFEADGTLNKNSDPGHLELRAMLDEPIAQHTIGKYAKEVRALEIYMCWMDVQEFKSIPTVDYRRSKASQIYHKYIKIGGVLEVGGITQAERDEVKERIDGSKSEPLLLSPDFFDRLQSKCFLEIYHNIFCPFKANEGYSTLTQTLKSKYNHVRPDDFDYMNKLGEGGFGFVVHCKKKSTGKHYAMKIQTKKGLLDCFSDDPRRADFEKQAFAACQHPFIVNLDYAFQSDTLAIMVLGLATAGDLQRAQRRAPDERLSEDRVRFYAAEIILGLSHLHQMGLMYRDLKPNNVLLNADGHIQLVDLGGVLDEGGRVLGLHNETAGLAPLFGQHFKHMQQLETITEDAPQEENPDPRKERERKKKTKRMSIMGTFGYMAPEMVIMLGQTSVEKTGYTNAVDWWSLGVTLFKLLTGYRPFSEDNFNTFVEMVPSINGRQAPSALPEYVILFQQIPFPPYISDDAADLISRLLDVNDRTRLGGGPGGLKNLKDHRFFASIDWELLGQKQVEPPFRPEPKELDEIPYYPNFETMLRESGKGQWLVDVPRMEDQKYFAAWDFASPQALRIEYGIANELQQYERNYKARKLMGDLGEVKGPVSDRRQPVTPTSGPSKRSSTK